MGELEKMSTYRSSYRKSLRLKYKGLGLCVECGRDKKLGFLHCALCLGKERLRGRRRGPRNSARLKIEVLTKYGEICICCKEANPIFLTIDHINNDGAAHRKRLGKRKFYPWLKQNNFPPGFQVLCYNCNRAKYLNGGTCPHQDRVRTEMVASPPPIKVRPYSLF